MQKQQAVYGNIVKILSRNNSNEITEFTAGNTTDSFNFKAKITGQTGNDETKMLK